MYMKSLGYSTFKNFGSVIKNYLWQVYGVLCKIFIANWFKQNWQITFVKTYNHRKLHHIIHHFLFAFRIKLLTTHWIVYLNQFDESHWESILMLIWHLLELFALLNLTSISLQFHLYFNFIHKILKSWIWLQFHPLQKLKS